MKHLLTILAGAAALLTVTACDKCEDVERPLTTALTFRLLSPTGKDLVGFGPGLYHPDSVRYRLINQPQYSRVNATGFSSGVFLLGVDLTQYNDGNEGLARFVLYLNHTDTDTLDVSYLIKREKCFVTAEYTRLTYNFRPATLDKDQGWWVVSKR